jgi:hypothetical protein
MDLFICLLYLEMDAFICLLASSTQEQLPYIFSLYR